MRGAKRIAVGFGIVTKVKNQANKKPMKFVTIFQVLKEWFNMKYYKHQLKTCLGENILGLRHPDEFLENKIKIL